MSIALSDSARKVLNVLNASRKPLSAYEILAKLARAGLRSPPTVYRALNQLGRKGLVHRVETMNAFVACRRKACAAYGVHAGVFAICTGCSAVEELDDPLVGKAMAKTGRNFLVRIEKKTLELSGLCRACSAKKTRKG